VHRALDNFKSKYITLPTCNSAIESSSSPSSPHQVLPESIASLPNSPMMPDIKIAGRQRQNYSMSRHLTKRYAMSGLMSEEEYLEQVLKVQKYIRARDVLR